MNSFHFCVFAPFAGKLHSWRTVPPNVQRHKERSLDPKPIEVGIAGLAGLSCPDGKESDLRADPPSLPRRERVAHRQKFRPIRAVTEIANSALRHFNPQIESIALY